MISITEGLIGMVVLIAVQTPGMLEAQPQPDSVGLVRLAVQEGGGWAIPGTERRLSLALTTVERYGCGGYRIDNSFSQSADTLYLVLHRILGPEGVCPTLLAPASMGREIGGGNGRYTIIITSRGSQDGVTLVVTDTSFQLHAMGARFVEADERLWWRRPANSMALFCGPVTFARAVCDDVQQWLQAKDGIRELHFQPNGVDPYWPYFRPWAEYVESFFLYANDNALNAVRRCFVEMKGQINAAARADVRVLTWTGENFAVGSGSFGEPHAAMQQRVTAGPECSR